MSANRRNWTEVDIVAQHIQDAALFLANFTASEFKRTQSAWLAYGGGIHTPLESPLEAIFQTWWLAVSAAMPERGDFILGQQHQVQCASGESYRLDFLVDVPDDAAASFAGAGRPFPLIGVELDGHAFHEKTLAQVTYRNARDRALQREGWRIFHYSFSEMTAEPSRCIMEVMDHAFAEVLLCQRAVWDIGADAVFEKMAASAAGR